ncbi:hypothetical protein ACF3NT_11605 [Naumannella halotolerans]|uniref:Uncharacterized protein n=1 Tax=Naumannella halotolerans TaxID=993414 RepID=A0A4R7J4J7_9ACTN|nr:hypothetical protein [Naumannella halotolerans]TDT31299.1 hypothetical protein CLV29_2714 [Naumannella halotolerans]
MSSITTNLRARREAARARRALNRAINNAATPAMRDELLIIAQRRGNI